ncbi:MAG TPA: Gfo/Idh/MocA family oxidoreductase [Clostridia bacterium]|nr:Gfo/Idh/MocA family oxidoreductase [Clostridia bacterium]
MKAIKLGVLGARRGLSFARSAKDNNSGQFDLVSICDYSSSKIEKAAKDFNVEFYSDYNDLLDSGIDAVVLANFFHQHTPFAVRAMESGKHVLSETIPAGTMAEAVKLCETVEETRMTYMFAENYPFTKIGLAMKKEFESGTLGDIVYAEGEYIHPIEPAKFNEISPGIDHWRNWIPSTYYSTHSLAPLMFMTGLKPVKVNALSIANDKVSAGTPRRNDPLAIIMCTMDNGSVFRITGWGTAGGHSVRYRLIGEYGTIESPRQHEGGYFGNGQVNITLNELRETGDRPHMYSYSPEWPEDARDAEKSGHGGGDYFMNKIFADSIHSGKSPLFFDVYDGAAMSAVAILGWRSALEGGKPYDIPNFRNKEERDIFRNDHSSPFQSEDKRPDLPPSIKGERIPSEEDIRSAKAIWEK